MTIVSGACDKKRAIRLQVPKGRRSSRSYTPTHNLAFTAAEGVHKAIVGRAGLCPRMRMKISLIESMLLA